MFPSAIHPAATRLFVLELIPALNHLASALDAKAAKFASMVKVGRTHLMDAVPVTLGQEFGGYAAAVRHDAERVEEILPRIGELPEGGPRLGRGSYIGYEAAAQIAHEALATGETIRSIVIARGYVSPGRVTPEQLDAALDVLAMTGQQSDDT